MGCPLSAHSGKSPHYLINFFYIQGRTKIIQSSASCIDAGWRNGCGDHRGMGPSAQKLVRRIAPVLRHADTWPIVVYLEATQLRLVGQVGKQLHRASLPAAIPTWVPVHIRSASVAAPSVLLEGGGVRAWSDNTRTWLLMMIQFHLVESAFGRKSHGHVARQTLSSLHHYLVSVQHHSCTRGPVAAGLLSTRTAFPALLSCLMLPFWCALCFGNIFSSLRVCFLHDLHRQVVSCRHLSFYCATASLRARQITSTRAVCVPTTVFTERSEKKIIIGNTYPGTETKTGTVEAERDTWN